VRKFEAFVGSEWTSGVIRWGTVLALLLFKRFRHLFVYLGALLIGGALTSGTAHFFSRARPVGVEMLAHWEGASVPSRPVAALAATLVGVIYTLVVPGKWRNQAKIAVGFILGALALSRLYLGVDHPTDVLVGLVFGVTIPLIAFRTFCPNDVFPVRYKRGRAAHLDIGGIRGEAIRTALEEQLGLTVVEMKPFGLGGSGGSTPLRLKVAEYPDRHLFAKLYASTHLRADRWYKLGRTLLYGRLEDERAFATVRRLVQYEDYLLRVMRDAGIHVPAPHGFAEISPEREYMLVTDFVEGSHELLDVEVNDEIIDGTLELVSKLWAAGIAHRDIKPSNILVRGNEVHVIDVAFGEIRPSPWRQAVDLANAMIVLALRSNPDHVYERALAYFSPEEIAEAFAATKGVTLPSQSRNLLRKDGRAIIKRFRELAPERRPISIQRWSVRRVGLTLGVLVGALIIFSLVVNNLVGAGLIVPPSATRASYSYVGLAPECHRVRGEGLVLEVQAVPTAQMIPCLDAPPLGWSFKAFTVRNGEARLILDSDRGGFEAVEVTLTQSCDTSGATRVPSDEAGAQRYEQVDTLTGAYSGRRMYVFEGGCVTYDFDFEGEGSSSLAEEASLAVGFLTRDEVEEDYERFSDLDLR
jgi:tRNA A-37 threonylcarbamoyl transferase component Bud32